MYNLSNFDFDLDGDSDFIDYLLMDAALFPPEKEPPTIAIDCEEETETKEK